MDADLKESGERRCKVVVSSLPRHKTNDGTDLKVIELKFTIQLP